MSPPNERGPASQPSPQETATATPTTVTRTDGGTPAYVSIRDQVAAGIITTTRSCSSACWCHSTKVGPDTGSTDYWDWRMRMDSLAYAIRTLEVREGVLGI